MEDDTIKLLRECNAGIKMGVTSLNDVLDHVNDTHMRDILQESKNVCIYRPDRAHCTAFQCMASADTVHAFRSSVHDDYSGIGIPASVNRASSSSTLSSR